MRFSRAVTTDVPTQRPNGGPWVTLIAIGATVLAVLPVFLTGSLAVYMRKDLHFDAADLGLSIAVFFGAGGSMARTAGRVVQRFGPQRGLQAAAIISATAMAGIPYARSWGQLTVLLALGGAANALVQPAANMMISDGIRLRRLGIALGGKQSAVLMATLLAGAAVPVLGQTLGWRAAYFMGAGCAAAFAAVISGGRWKDRRPANIRSVDRSVRKAFRPLRWIALGGALAAGAGTSMGAFIIPAAVDAGIDPGLAGWVVSLASLAGIACRLFYGWLVDRAGATSGFHPLTLVIVLLVTGSLGPLLLIPGSLVLMSLGALVGFCLSWGWTGVMHYAVASRHPAAPAAATGVIQTGLAWGASVGPLFFGAVAAYASYAWAWAAAACLLLAGAALIRVGAGRSAESLPSRT